jgi:hypothetical protein
MTNHTTPTKEELKQQELDAIAAAEAIEKNPPTEQEEDQAKEDRAIEEATGEKKEVKTDEKPTEKEEKTEDLPVEDKEDQADPSPASKEKLQKELDEKNKKLSASAREAQKLLAKNRTMNEALIEAEDIPEPTTEELEAEFKDWDAMSDIEKNFAKETLVSKKWRNTIKLAKDKVQKIEKWNESVDEFATNPQSLLDAPELEGKTEEFKEFAKAEENNSVPFKILVSAFLHENSKGKVENKGSMFPEGKGGDKSKNDPTSDKISLEDARKIRETDYPKYKELLMSGKIDSGL